MFVIEGTVYQNIEYERHVYPAGSCCLINTNTQHIEEYHNASRILFLQLSKNFARNLFTAEQYFPTEDALCNGLMKNFFLQTLHQKNPAQKEYIDFIPLRDASWVKQYIHSIFEKMFHEIQEPVFGSSFRLCAFVWNCSGICLTKITITTHPSNPELNQKEYCLNSSHNL